MIVVFSFQPNGAWTRAVTIFLNTLNAPFQDRVI